ncbi:hypothetical protein ACJX0J_036546 [Zea mays]
MTNYYKYNLSVECNYLIYTDSLVAVNGINLQNIFSSEKKKEARMINRHHLAFQLFEGRFLVFITAVEAFSDQIHKHLLCVYMFKLVNIIDYAFFDILYVLDMFFFICRDLVQK